MDSIDVNGNSRIDYEEFLAATLHLTKLNREEQMINAFKFFDKDESGFITKDEIVVRCCACSRWSEHCEHPSLASMSWIHCQGRDRDWTLPCCSCTETALACTQI